MEPVSGEQKDTTSFTWHDPESVVIKSVQAVAVYPNPDGDVVIRQERAGYDDEDDIVIIPADRVEDVIAAIKRAADNVTF